MTVRILTGDCRDMLRTLPDESVHCVVTSPPYWGLRDYGVDGQLGLERSLGEHVAVMVEVFREVRRVLRKDGTLWLNYGDSYATSVNGRSAADTKAAGNDDRTFRDKPFSTVGPISRVGASGNKGNGGADHGGRVVAGGFYNPNNRNEYGGKNARKQAGSVNPGGRIEAGGYLKPKDLCGIPWRVAFALQDDGWYLRQDIIWAKPNPMPESIRDRCTKSHEYLFLLAKSPRYYFDQEAIKEAAEYDPTATKAPDGWDTGAGGHGSFHRNGREKGRRTDSTNGSHVPGATPHNGIHRAGTPREPATRNKRSVWTVPTAPYSDAHFATFPPALIEPCIKAGTSERGCCAKCGAPWVRQVERGSQCEPARKGGPKTNGVGIHNSADRPGGFYPAAPDQLGWSPSCKCAAATVPCFVLDPFGGAGTTGLVADRLQRDAILIELNPEYAAMARKRIEGDAPLFAAVDDYDGHKDFAASYDECLREVRERRAEGGPGWIPREAAE